MIIFSFFQTHKKTFYTHIHPTPPILGWATIQYQYIQIFLILFKEHSMTWMYQFIRHQSSIEKHVDCFQSTAILNNAAVNMFFTEIFPYMCIYKINLKSEITKSKIRVFFILILPNYPPKRIILHKFIPSQW